MEPGGDFTGTELPVGKQASGREII
jgi:hypothetical protein